MTMPKCTANNTGMAEVFLESIKARPVTLMKNNKAMNPRSMGLCCESPCWGSRAKFKRHKPRVPIANAMPPTVPNILGKLV